MDLAIQYYFLLHYMFWVPVIFKDFVKKKKFYLTAGITACILGFFWEAICIYYGYWTYLVGFRVLGVPLCVVSGYFIYMNAVYFLASRGEKK